LAGILLIPEVPPTLNAPHAQTYQHLQAAHLPGRLTAMIPHAEFERALTQWKIRKQGGQVATPSADVASGAVVGEMPLANAEPGMLPSGEVAGDTNSGATPSGGNRET